MYVCMILFLSCSFLFFLFTYLNFWMYSKLLGSQPLPIEIIKYSPSSETSAFTMWSVTCNIKRIWQVCVDT